MQKTEARIYELHTETGQWLGRIVLTYDGMFAAASDWGNFTFFWNFENHKQFREFLIGLNINYFGSSMCESLKYITSGESVEVNCNLFAEKILPALQVELKKEIQNE
jgi:hypothetical protein